MNKESTNQPAEQPEEESSSPTNLPQQVNEPKLRWSTVIQNWERYKEKESEERYKKTAIGA